VPPATARDDAVEHGRAADPQQDGIECLGGWGTVGEHHAERGREARGRRRMAIGGITRVSFGVRGKSSCLVCASSITSAATPRRAG
jgi:hypothetical protein